MREDSSRVRLEIAFLDADEGASAPVTPATHDERAWRTVLVVAAESDVRRYVGECLRERTDLRLVEAATVAAAELGATGHELTSSRPAADGQVDYFPRRLNRRAMSAHASAGQHDEPGADGYGQNRSGTRRHRIISGCRDG